MANLAAKYRPRSFEDVTEQSVIVNMMKNICSQENLVHRNFLFIGPAGTGKAQPMYSKVLTPSGFIQMKDVQIGTEVFTASGNIGKVSGIYPQGARPIYEITIQDGTSIRVSDEHLNVVYRYNEDKKKREYFTLTTTDLMNLFETSRFKLRVDVPKLDWEGEQGLPIDPYLVGALIGDDCLRVNFSFSNPEEDVIEKVDYILRRDWNKMLRKCPGDNNVDYSIVDINYSDHKYDFYYKGIKYETGETIRQVLHQDGYPLFDAGTIVRLCDGTGGRNIFKQYPELQQNLSMEVDPNYRSWVERDPLLNAIRDLHMNVNSVDKRIPEAYLFTSRENRIRLLQGLYDTDGYTTSDGLTYWSTCSEQLSEDFAFLVRSLGIRDRITSAPCKYKINGEYKYTGNISYDHALKIPNGLDYCTSAKHMARRTVKQTDPQRNIVSIEYVGTEECQCIMVDHEDHTYISDGFIPTHNTTSARIVANMINNGQCDPIEIDAASHSGVDSVRELVKQMKTYPVGCSYKVFIFDEAHAFSSQAWQSLLKPVEEQPAKTVIIFCTTNPEKIPQTILSRVQTFQLSKISLDGIVSRLKYIVEEENKTGRNITYTEEAIAYIAKMANGGMRDSITLLEKSLSYSTDITIENLSKSLDLPNYDDYFALLNGIAKKDNTSIVTIINDVYNSGINFTKWFEGFHSFISNIIKYIFMQDINQTLIPSHYQPKISSYGVAHATLCLKLANKLVKLNQEMKTTQYQQELAITYLCQAPAGK